MNKAVWEKTCAALRNENIGLFFSSWIDQIQYVDAASDSITIAVPSRFFQDYLKDNYLSLIENKLAEISEGKTIKLQTVILPEKSDAEKSAASADAPAVTTSEAGDEQKPAPPGLHPLLNQKHVFENFIVGDSNGYAHAAALRVSSAPGRQSRYNPLIFYSGVGLGKTHLIHAIGHRIYQTNPRMRIVYVTTDDFLTEFIAMIQKGAGAAAAFTSKFRGADVLLMDDIQFLQGKESTQIELFNIFNKLYDAGRQMVFACDRPPQDLKQLDDRLRNRFEKGPAIDIQPPSVEVREAILRRMMEDSRLRVPDDILGYIAANITTDIRKLEGAFHKIATYIDLVNAAVDLEEAREVLKDFVRPKNKEVSADEVVRRVAQYFNISPSEMKSHKKHKSIVFPRQISMYLVRRYTELTLNEIANEFGGRNHATVLFAFRKIEAAIQKQAEVKQIVDNIVNELNI